VSEGIKIAPIDPLAGLVEVTPDEEAAWLVTYGRITTVTRDGKRYRLIESWEDGAQAAPST
jgi:hypothetical protein